MESKCKENDPTSGKFIRKSKLPGNQTRRGVAFFGEKGMVRLVLCDDHRRLVSRLLPARVSGEV
ncbi:MAG: hypothetical protein D6714_12680 [Bacteroidetes bacterium]|nr:MAG: hypothetical protein D6714_12680 [Bacteroidota bacterium]